LDELQPESPFVLSFGPRYCSHMATVRVSYRDANGVVHELKKVVDAPDDTKRHTYTLEWHSVSTYRLLIDGEEVSFGRIADDFFDD